MTQSAIAVPLAAALVILAGCSSASGDPGRETGPIIVELFTSQGCSSCPPADRLLSKLVAGDLADREVVPLAFHVDYWDDLGWADPFALGAWTERQRRYNAAMDTGRVYTPQLVIGGRAHVVGSNRAAVGASIAGATVPARIDAAIEWSDGAAKVTATAPATGDAWVAIYEDAITTAVARGENAGERLRNDHIVRRFERVAAAGARATIDVTLDARWKKLGAVVLAQGKDMAIVGSRALPAR